MSTIKTYKADESASTRLAVWEWTWDYVKDAPVGRRLRNVSPEPDPLRHRDGRAATTDNATVDTSSTVDKARAYHSAYFEMLGEQGYPGLVAVADDQPDRAGPDGGDPPALPQGRRRTRRGSRRSPARCRPAHLVYLLGAAFIAIAFQPFIYMLIGAQIGLDTYLARKRAEASFAADARKPAALRPAPA